MADLVFNTGSGKTIARERLVAYLNTGTAATPIWSVFGKRVTDSSIALDWAKDTKRDILGDTYTTIKKATKTETFDPCYLDAGDDAIVKLWNTAIKDEDTATLCAEDVLIVHYYADTGSVGANAFAERYSTCTIIPTGLGGEGGDFLTMPLEVTFGGTRTLGTAVRSSAGVVTFTADT